MNLWQDLRRRHVFRLIGLYIVGAWAVLEVAATFFPAWGIPDTALRYLIVAAALCFPVAIVFSWFFDITVDGIVRTPRSSESADADYRLKRTDYLILASLAAVSIAVIYNSITQVQESSSELPATVEAAANSIAVLPFSNFDSDPNTQYFSDGVTEEILHRLSEFNALRVLARTSSFAFADSELTVPKISAILGVRYLLQGSVRRDLDQVRITAQLIDSDGTQVWSETFDRKLEGIFAIQSDIANAVASQLVDRIAPRMVRQARTTANMDAYQEYLIGREYLYRRSPGWSQKASAAFRHAIELDPGYAPPYAGLAVSVYLGPSDRPAPPQTIIANAIAYAEQALALDPDLAEAHAAQGLLYMDGPNVDPVAAEASLRRAIALDPSVTNAYNWLANALAQQNRRDEGWQVRQQGLDIDPLNPIMTINLASYHKEQGDIQRAEALLLRLLALPSPPEHAYYSLFDLYSEYGRMLDAVRLLAGWRAVGLASGNAEIRYGLAVFFQKFGMREEADRWYQRAVDIDPIPTRVLLRKARMLNAYGDYDHLRTHMEAIDRNNPIDLETLPYSAMDVLATARVFAGQYAEGIALAENILDLDQLRPQDGMMPAEAVYLLHTLAYAYQTIGKSSQAAASLELAESFLDAQQRTGGDASPAWLELRALNLAMRGHLHDAAAALALAVDAGWRNSRLVVHDPRWQPLLNLPEVAPLLAVVEEDLDRQALEIEAIVARLGL